jgi:hypothetical protein
MSKLLIWTLFPVDYKIKMDVATQKNKGDLSVTPLICTLHIKTVYRHQTGFFMVVFESVKGAVKAVTLCG